MKKTPYGYTLIELITALTIMLILLSYGIPNYQDFKKNQALRQAVNNFVGTIQFARNQSVNASEHIILCPSKSMTDCDGESQWHLGWMVFVDTNKNRAFDEREEVLFFEPALTNNISAVSSKYRPRVRFDQMGASPGTNLTIRFCDDRGPDSGKAVIISNVGRPRVAQKVKSCD